MGGDPLARIRAASSAAPGEDHPVALALSSHGAMSGCVLMMKALGVGCNVSRGLARSRTVDPLLTMRSDRQLVATHGNGFGLI
jgi:hypothetical protein